VQLASTVHTAFVLVPQACDWKKAAGQEAQAEHTRSAVALPGKEIHWFTAHDLYPWQKRSLLGVLGTASYSVLRHTVRLAHTVSEMAVEGTLMY
jgi:hypothetical protein